MNKHTRSILLIAAAGISFSIAHTLGRLIYGSCGGTVFTYILLNNLIVIPIMAFIMRRRSISFRIPSGLWGALLLLGVCNTATSIFLNLSFVYVGVGLGNMIHMMYPLFVALAEARFRPSGLSRPTRVALVLVLLGIVIISQNGASTGQISLLGVLLALISGIAYASFLLIMGRKDMEAQPPLFVLFYSAVISALIMLGLTLSTNTLAFSSMLPLGWGLNLLSALLVCVVGFFCIQSSIQYVGPTLTSILGATEPLMSILLGCTFLHETMTLTKAIGAALILFGALYPSLCEMGIFRRHKEHI